MLILKKHLKKLNLSMILSAFLIKIHKKRWIKECGALVLKWVRFLILSQKFEHRSIFVYHFGGVISIYFTRDNPLAALAQVLKNC